MHAAFVRYTPENASGTIGSFYFRPEARYRYEAGQYAVVTVPHANHDTRGQSRTMTLTSSPNDELLSITMRLYKNRGSSYKNALQALQPGDTVTIFDAMGDLVLPLDTSIPLVFVAGGVGIASFVGMMKWLRQQRQHRHISLHYAARSADDVVLLTPFDRYDSFNPIEKRLYISEGARRTDRLSAARITPSLLPESLIYISGTEKMVEDIRSQLLDAGINRRQIVFDYFDGYNDI